MTKSRDIYAIGGLLALALAIGGAGLSFPRLQMLLQIAALACGAYILVSRRDWRLPRLSVIAMCLLAAILVFPLLQLVPLPPGIWTQLPGRALPAELDAALGVVRWRPLTLDAEATVRSFLPLVPPAVVFAGCLFLSRSDRTHLLWVVFVLAFAGALLGIVQLGTGGSLTPYPSGHSGFPIGLFVNRNHNAALMLVAMPVTAALASIQVARGKPQTPWVVASLSAMTIFALVVLATTSRMGLLLLPVAIAASLVLLLYRRASLRLVFLSVVALAAVAALLLARGGFDRTVSRFTGLHDARFDSWTDIQWALDYYGLAGTGFGTFVPVYKSAESLEAVAPQIFNHAHNDYLELLLEGGLPAVVLMLVFTGIMAAALIRSLNERLPAEQSVVKLAAFVGILILLAASIVDYPLRMPALSVLFALLCAILLPSFSALARSQGRPASTSTEVAILGSARRVRAVPVVIGVAAVAAVLIAVVQAGMSAHSLAKGRNDAAVAWAGWSVQAHERLSTAALVRSNFPAALSHAHSANALSPISAPAIRTIGLVHLSQGAVDRGNRIMQAAVVLGWRDPLTQLWAIEAAKASREPQKALQRAEALFRQDMLAAAAIAHLLTPAAGSDVPGLLVRKLAERPAWRGAFFKASGELSLATTAPWLKLVEALDRSAAPVSAEEGEPSLNALVAAGRMDEAQRLWELLRDGNALVSNGDFEQAAVGRGAQFAVRWSVPNRNRALVRVEAPAFDPNNRALHIRSTEDSTILQQMLMLRPGNYRLAHRAHVQAPRGATLRWAVRCSGSGPRQSSDVEVLPGAKWHAVAVSFTVPERNCPIQRLVLGRSDATPLEDVWLDEIRVERVAR
jgi:O-antigen ligase